MPLCFRALEVLYKQQLNNGCGDKQCTNLYCDKFFARGIGKELQVKARFAAHTQLSCTILSMLGEKGLCPKYANASDEELDKMLAGTADRSDITDYSDTPFSWENFDCKNRKTLTKSQLAALPAAGYEEKLNQLDPHGYLSATRILTVLFDPESTEKDDITHLNKLVVHVMTKFKNTSNELFFVNNCSNALVTNLLQNSRLRNKNSKEPVTTRQISVKGPETKAFVEALNTITKMVSRRNARFVACPPQISSIFDKTLAQYPNSESYNSIMAKRVLRSWPSCAAVFKTKYLKTILKHVEQSEAKQDWFEELKLMEGNCRPVELLYPIEPHTNSRNKIYRLKDMPSVHPTHEKAAMFKFYNLQKMLYGSNASRSSHFLQFLCSSVRKIGFNEEIYDRNVLLLQAVRNETRLVGKDGKLKSNLDITFKSIIEAMVAPFAYPLHKPLRVEFLSELGQDAGGVQIDFFNNLAKELLNPKNKLFEKNGLNTWFSDMTISDEKGRTDYYFVGVLLGLALYNSNTVAMNFPIFFYQCLLMYGKYGSFIQAFQRISRRDKEEALLDILPESQAFNVLYSRSDRGPADTGTPFSIPRPLVEQTDSLIPKVLLQKFSKELDAYVGTVSKKNVYAVVEVDMWSHLYNVNGSKMDSMFAGFYSIVDRSQVAMFTPDELRFLMQGYLLGSAEDLHNNSTTDSNVPPQLAHWFWDVVEKDFSEDQVCQLIQFVTGTERVSVAEVHNGVRFVVGCSMTANRNSLPTASVCASTIFLPNYQSRKVLKEKLIKAMEMGRGFELA